MRHISLATRLLLAFGFVALVSTMSVGLWVRGAIRQSEDRRFARQLQRTRQGLRLELEAERNTVQDLLHPLCAHDAFVDKTWIDLKANRLTPGRRLAIQQVVQEETKALRLDELVLLTEDGTILGAGKHLAWLGTKRPKLASLVKSSDAQFQPLQSGWAIPGGDHTPMLMGRCLTEQAAPRIGLVGQRNLTPVLARMANVYGVRIAVAGSHDDHLRSGESSTSFTLDGAQRFVVFTSRNEIDQALSRLDRVLVITGLTTLIGALLIALLLARGLARPLALLAEQVRAAVSHTPREVSVQGTPEVRTVAESFNATMRELAKVQRRQAAMERIAAWREVARRVAHEIKNPLTPIRTSIETLRRLKARNDPKFNDYFDQATRTMLDEVLRIASIASSFSKFARLPQPKLAPVDVRDIAASTVAMHEGGDVILRFEQVSCPLGLADRDQITQVLTNLIQNAMDSAREREDSDPSSPQVFVKIFPEQSQWITIEVHDNGPGVDASLTDKIFEPYITTKEHGSGLGLPIVQRIVVEHQGEISYVTSPLGGACFVVRLPTAPISPPEPNKSA